MIKDKVVVAVVPGDSVAQAVVVVEVLVVVVVAQEVAEVAAGLDVAAVQMEEVDLAAADTKMAIQWVVE